MTPRLFLQNHVYIEACKIARLLTTKTGLEHQFNDKCDFIKFQKSFTNSERKLVPLAAVNETLIANGEKPIKKTVKKILLRVTISLKELNNKNNKATLTYSGGKNEEILLPELLKKFKINYTIEAKN